MDSSAADKAHWEKIYAHKQPQEISWTQPVPATSMQFIEAFNLPREAPIIDVGGGDSRLVDYLLAAGYRNLTVLDISGTALVRARQRLGAAARHVQWVEADVRAFVPPTRYALWHDRAAFHFLTTAPEIAHYLHLARTAVDPGGFLTLGTFSPARLSAAACPSASTARPASRPSCTPGSGSYAASPRTTRRPSRPPRTSCSAPSNARLLRRPDLLFALFPC